jgi:N6-L-threonylcarbamoyladenine synthase
MCASFQEAALGHLWSRVESVLDEYDVKQVVLAGGVAANSRLREICTEKMSQRKNVSYIIPPLSCCTDNAAMIGASGYIAYKKGIFCDLDVEADPSLEM